VKLDEKANPSARVSAATALLDRAFGKPLTTVASMMAQVDPSSLNDAGLARIIEAAKPTNGKAKH
jgi:hypothetical protein